MSVSWLLLCFFWVSAVTIPDPTGTGNVSITTIPSTRTSDSVSGTTIPGTDERSGENGLPFCQPPLHDIPALHRASSCGWAHAVHVLLEHGALVDFRDSNDRTPLMLAVSSASFARYPDYEAVVLDLLGHGAEVDKQDLFGWSSVHHAAMVEGRKNRSLLALLVDRTGADILLHDVYGWTPYTLAKYNHRVWNEQFLEVRGGDPSYWARLLHAILHPYFLYAFYIGCGLAVVHTLLLLLATKCECAWMPGQERTGPPLGARLLAAETCMYRDSKGPFWSRFLLLVYMSEVMMNMVFVFGYCMYCIKPAVMVPLWILFWVLPSAAYYGINEVIVNPALAVTAGPDAKMAIFSIVRWVTAALLSRYGQSIPSVKNEVLEFVFSPSQYHADLQQELVYWDNNATFSFLFLEIHNINMHTMFKAYQMAVMALSGAAALMLALAIWKRHGADGLDAAEVRRLAGRIDKENIKKIVREEKVKEVVWYPRCADLELGLLLQCGILAVDIFLFDVGVILDMVARQHYNFFACMLAIFLSSLFAELIVDSLCSFPRQFRESLANGYLTDGLLGMTQREAGLESFAQLAFTAYALPFVSDSPRALLNLIFSMLLSTFGLGSHLFTSIEYERATRECALTEEDEEEENEEEATTDSESTNIVPANDMRAEVHMIRWLLGHLPFGHV